MMTSYEKYMAVIQGEAVDCLPRLPILMSFAANYIGSNYGEFASDYRVLVEANCRCAQDFDFDQVSAISDPYREASGFGADIRFIKDGVPLCVYTPLADSKDLSRLLRPDPYKSTRMLDRIKAVESLAGKVGEELSILGWVEGPAAEAANLRGVSTFLIDLIEDPAFAHQLMDCCVEVGIDFALAQLRAGADTIGIGDAIVSQISGPMYKELVYPHEKRLVDAIHAVGGLVRLHICGNITHHLEQIAELGVEVLDADWLVDMNKARSTVGRSTVLCSNLDPVHVVQRGTPKGIMNAVKELYQQLGNPFMVGAGCEIPADTPHPNLKALCTPVPYKA